MYTQEQQRLVLQNELATKLDEQQVLCETLHDLQWEISLEILSKLSTLDYEIQSIRLKLNKLW